MQLFASSVIILLFLSFGTIRGQTPLTDSLEQVLPGLSGKEKMRALADLTWEWSSMNTETAVRYGREYLRAAEQSRDSSEVGEAANMLTVALYRKGLYEEALKMNTRAYRIRKSSGDLRQIGSSLNKFVNIYADRVMLDSALKYGLESVRIFEALGDSGNLAICYNTISSVYQKERDWEASFRYGQLAFQIADRLGFEYARGGAAGNLGVACESLGRFDESIAWYEIARQSFELAGSKPDLATVANNLGFVYRKKGDLDRALTNYHLALNMAEEMGERNGIAHYSANLGGIYNAQKNYAVAKTMFDRALHIAEQEGLGRVRLQCYDGLAEIAARQGRNEESVQLFRRYIDLKDSLYNEERSAQLAEMRTRYDSEKKERENSFLKAENELKDRRNRAIATGSASALVLLSLSGVLLYQSRRRAQEIRFQRELLLERERGLIAVFDATEEERRRIARDLHDGIGQQLSGLKLGWDGLRHQLSDRDQTKTDQLRRLSEVLDESAKEVRNLSHQMMPRTLQERGLLVALEDMVRKSFAFSDVTYRIEHFQVEHARFSTRVEIGMFRIAQELVNNILKHSGANAVTIQLLRNKDRLILITEDNGKGFSPDQKADGIGMLNVASRLSTIGGELSWERGPEGGMVATVRVPLSSR